MKGLTLGERGEYALDTGPSILQLPGVLEKIFERSGKRLADYVMLTPVEPNTRVHLGWARRCRASGSRTAGLAAWSWPRASGSRPTRWW